MNITGAVAGNPRFHHIKTAMSSTVFSTPFQITIVRIVPPCLFCIVPCKAYAMLVPRSRALKKPYGASCRSRIGSLAFGETGNYLFFINVKTFTGFHV